ncbi:RagB/SusD family nutrient uptake outer membrane protein [Chitinophaga nivalis]|uniref:RagB/SusD family nutrient uptake outer membrane protein n=1 Tax=Chitinophaga nivalis TaxID=2991709 RepID=A0ABT3ITQ8_9BACT|nr:RagB/SusD family nutrient uptake outer membrane protein [Chitinophaga nivalis]MCW3462949.1 RagB/SusD family nutrient uptake outer membrane protein [Chitinophaga nivalis]MCW3487361.1 RagB/SusD family nutrient uptake outer membrane protein [Chitinophaga nivalis]
MRKIIFTLLLLLPVLLFTACKKWLDVRPRDKVAEADLFNSEDGFFNALNGVYLDLTSNDLYGGQMNMQMTEVLAQRYNIASGHDLYKLVTYDYASEEVKTILDRSWQGLYRNVANINKIFSVIDERRDLFTGNHFGWVKGELFALRAYLHFDAFRLFGPVYIKDSLAKRIPYYTTFTSQYNPLLSGSEVMQKVLTDLDSAAFYLKNDPVITGGRLFFPDPNGNADTWQYRSLRMNYFAVMALKARAYLYANNKPAALQCATAVMQQIGDKFPLVTSDRVTGPNPDRVFSSEILFALHDIRLNDKFLLYFSPEQADRKILAAASNRLESDFEKKEPDPRYGNTWLRPSDNKKSFRCFYKYADIPDTRRNYRNLIPMIRISEMYFIAAECQPDEATALTYINAIRKVRNVSDVLPGMGIDAELKKDYKREFYGEGQVFFYYKRTFTGSIPAGSGSGNVTMTTKEYTLPLPDSEIQFRN